jgi:hypothetical protein
MGSEELHDRRAADFAWVPFHRALATRLAKYESDQLPLIDALRAAGVRGGLTDEDEPLSEIDPFTFFSLVHKHKKDATRSRILGHLAEKFSIAEAVPNEFPGVPVSNAMKAWLFPFRSLRTGEEAPLLWRAFHEARRGELAPETFDALLQVRTVGLAKLTQALFWVNPERYCPIDQVIAPYVQKRGIELERLDGRAYLRLIDTLAEELQISFPELSYEAWVDRQRRLEVSAEQGDRPEVNLEALHRYMQWFREVCPSFQSFADPGDYYRQAERNYKVELAQRYGNRVAPLLNAIRAGGGDVAQLGEAAIELFSFRLDMEDGTKAPQNLVPWRQFDPLKRIDPDARAEFGRALAELLDDGSPIGSRVEDFVSALRRVWASTGETLRRSDAQAITTFFLFLSDPTEHVFLKSTIFERALADLLPGHRLNTNEFTAYDYQTARALSRAVFRAFEAEGWEPQDLIDVQSFLYNAVRRAESTAELPPWRNPVAMVRVEPEYRKQNPKEPNTKAWYKFAAVAEYDGRLVGELHEAGPGYFERWPDWFGNRNWVSGELRWCYEHGFIRLVVPGNHNSQAPTEIATQGDKGQPMKHPLNLILYGPPGTGKTWQTARRAVRICDGSVPEEETELRRRYQELVAQQRIKFVSFHQSFSYEDFVEGIKPVLDSEGETANGEVKYHCPPGVFKEICQLASESRGGRGEGIDVSDRRIYKVSLGDTQDPGQQWVYQDCLDNEWIALGFGDDIDFSDAPNLGEIMERLRGEDEGVNAYSASVQAIQYLCNEMQRGDIVIVSDGNSAFRAIGEVTGAYQHRADRDWYRQVRPVRWLRVFNESLSVDQILGRNFSQRTLYRLAPDVINLRALNELLAADQESGERKNHVLIIDEINRANISRVMGELITLLEPDKRAGASNEIVVTLPYSRRPFTVPPNLYVIGTMNTADRSIALLDSALRRRFDFVEVAPDPAVLDGFEVAGVDVARMMTVMNRRIEMLFDRDHTVGHAYFLTALAGEDPDIESLGTAFQNRIIPLLEEYFFEDWGKIRLVLGDNRKPKHLQFIQSACDENEMAELFGPDDQVTPESGSGEAWRKNPDALSNPDAYRGIYESLSEVAPA